MDEEIRCLKAHMLDENVTLNCSVLGKKMVLNILNRLDAAEANMGGHSAKCTDKACVCSKKDRQAAWLRSKGLPPSGDGEKA